MTQSNMYSQKNGDSDPEYILQMYMYEIPSKLY